MPIDTKRQCSICKQHLEYKFQVACKCKHKYSETDSASDYIVCSDCVYDRSNEQRLRCSICYAYSHDIELEWAVQHACRPVSAVKNSPAWIIWCVVRCPRCNALELSLCDDCSKMLNWKTLSFSTCVYCDESVCGRHICKTDARIYENNETFICDDCLWYNA